MNLKNLPEVEFIKIDVEKMVSESQAIVEEILGRTIARADPLMLFLKSLVSILAQQNALINDLARQNLLAYARGDNLENLGALVGVERLKATPAKCTAKITLSASLNKAVTIKQGTRITAGDNLNFALSENITFLAGETEKTAKFECEVAGTVGNGYKIGTLKNIVDPQAFLKSVENITETDGGSDSEIDDSLRERIALAPESFSSAGPTGAYEFFVKQASNLITDVFIESEKPGEVDIYFLQEGNLPTAEVIELVEEKLNDRSVRPLTDKVVIKSPEIIYFSIDFTYWINQSDYLESAQIQSAVESGVQDFILWQRAKIGRDINNSELERRIIAAGAKRVEINLPIFRVVPDNAVAICEGYRANFAGLEDD